MTPPAGIGRAVLAERDVRRDHDIRELLATVGAEQAQAVLDVLERAAEAGLECRGNAALGARQSFGPLQGIGWDRYSLAPVVS